MIKYCSLRSIASQSLLWNTKHTRRYKQALNISHVMQQTDKSHILVFDCEERGPSLTAVIPGLYNPLGLCLAESPDLMGAMSPCPSKSSVCPNKPATLTNFPFT